MMDVPQTLLCAVAFGLVVLIGFVIVLTDKGLKWKKK